MKKLFVIAAIACAVVACTKESTKEEAFVAEVEKACADKNQAALDSLKGVYETLKADSTIKFDDAQKHFCDSVFAVKAEEPKAEDVNEAIEEAQPEVAAQEEAEKEEA